MKLYGPSSGPLYQGEVWHRSKIIQYCIEKHSYTSYLEIGFGNPNNAHVNWNKISAPKKVCVDPSWRSPDFVIKEKSEDYFETNTDTFDIIYIDGDHKATTVYNDILSSLDILNPGGMVLSHDNSPRSPEEESPKVSGDGWKALAFLRQRDDLDICVVNADAGLSMIKKRKNSYPLSVSPEDELHDFLSGKEPDFSKVGYYVLDKKRVEILNLLEIEEALKWL